MKKKGKIIHFPGLKERLLERSSEELQKKRYKEALHLLNEAYEIDPNDPEIELAITLCLFELGRLQEAKELGRKMLHEGKGNYAQTLQVYLSILIHLQEYEEVGKTINDILKHNDLPVTVRQNLINLLNFSNKMSEQPSTAVVEEEDNHIREWMRVLTKTENISEHIKIVKSFEQQDIIPVLPALQEYLAGEERNPFVKTMIIQLLSNKKITERIIVKKFGETVTIVPAELDDSIQSYFAREVPKIIESKIGGQNPSLYQIAESLWLRYLYILYPMIPKEAEMEAWAAALHMTASTYQGMEIEEKAIGLLYGVDANKILKLCESLYNIEEISHF